MLLFIVVLAFVIIGCGLAWFLVSHDHGEKEPISALWLAGGFGLTGAIAAAIIEYFLVPAHLINGSGGALGSILLASLGIGVIEESCKFLPLAAFIYKKQYFNEHTDGIIYFAVAGLAFGVPENILYSLQFGAGVGFARIIMTPLFHAATTSMVGYFLAKAKVEKGTLVKPLLALGAAMLLHGFYDFGLSSKNVLYAVLSLMITIGMSAVLFILFMRANELDRAFGLSRIGSNTFCRNCGQPNPNHSLYCTHCGQHA